MSRTTLALKMHSLKRDTSGMSDDELGDLLVGYVEKALPERRAPAVATIARPSRVDVLGLKAIIDARIHVNRFLAALTRADTDIDVEEPSAIGVMGTVRIRQPVQAGASKAPPAPPVPMGVVFLEWPDNRWWLWRTLLDAEGNPVAGTETRTRAVDGDPLPRGFGRWWSLGRRANLRLSMRRASDGTPVPVSRHVH